MADEWLDVFETAPDALNVIVRRTSTDGAQGIEQGIGQG
jgi:hypothetical protein